MNTLVWCIEHEEMTHMECGELCGHIHFVPVYDDGGVPIGADVEFCTYDLGFAFVAPPDEEIGWIESVVEQGSNELEVDLDAFVPHEAFELMREAAEV